MLRTGMSIVSVVEGNLRPTAGRRSIPAERGIGAPAAPARAPPQHDLRLSHFGWGRTIRMASQSGSLDILRRGDARGTHPCQTPARKKIHRLQMREGRRADLAFVGPVGSVGNEVDPEFALRRLDRGIDLA